MPAIFPVGSGALALIRSLASRGDTHAIAIMALMDNTYYCSMVAGTEAANSITVTIQVKDQDGQNVSGIKDVLVKTKPVAGTGLITDGGNGTISAGSGTTEAWCKTDVNGNLQVAIANVNAEGTLVVTTLDNGTSELLALAFV